MYAEAEVRAYPHMQVKEYAQNVIRLQETDPKSPALVHMIGWLSMITGLTVGEVSDNQGNFRRLLDLRECH